MESDLDLAVTGLERSLLTGPVNSTDLVGYRRWLLTGPVDVGRASLVGFNCRQLEGCKGDELPRNAAPCSLSLQQYSSKSTCRVCKDVL